MANADVHPTSQELTAFGLGKLPPSAMAGITAHVEVCDECRHVLAQLPPDSFLAKLRDARPGHASLPPNLSAKLAHPPAPAGGPPPQLPAELAHHPKFRILGELGRGGMGVIYLAEHRVLEKRVALKVINPTILDNPEAPARFQGEAKAAGRLDHPHIARAYDADQAGDLHFLVLEFVEGISLAQLLERKGPLPVAHACHYVRQAALGLQHAFEQGMVHRDIKPQNLMLTRKGQVKILDFGLARLRSVGAKSPRLTQLDSFMGTPEYVAPEQAMDARSADTRADIYSLGCTLYALLTGRPPFQEETVVKLVLAHIEKEPQPLHEVRPDVPAELATLVTRMLAKEPAQRYQRPIEVAQALAPLFKTAARAEGPAAATPAPASSGTRTMIGGDTSRVTGVSRGASVSARGRLKAENTPFRGLGVVPAGEPAQEQFKMLSATAEAAPKARGKRRALWVGGISAAVLLVLAGLWAAGALRIQARDGTLVLEDLPPDAEVRVPSWGSGKSATRRERWGSHSSSPTIHSPPISVSRPAGNRRGAW